MPNVTVHYGGWVMLPERLCKALHLGTGDQLTAELVEGGIVLRAGAAAPQRHAGGAATPPAEAADAAPGEPAATADEPVPDSGSTAGKTLSGARKARGRRKAAGQGAAQSG
jgi:antitoxin component of MazEF toxin-antitoxin module